MAKNVRLAGVTLARLTALDICMMPKQTGSAGIVELKKQLRYNDRK